MILALYFTHKHTHIHRQLIHYVLLQCIVSSKTEQISNNCTKAIIKPIKWTCLNYLVQLSTCNSVPVLLLCLFCLAAKWFLCSVYWWQIVCALTYLAPPARLAAYSPRYCSCPENGERFRRETQIQEDNGNRYKRPHIHKEVQARLISPDDWLLSEFSSPLAERKMSAE